MIDDERRGLVERFKDARHFGDVVSKRRDKFKDVISFPLPKRFSEETFFREGDLLAVHRFFGARRRDSVELVDDAVGMGGRSIFRETSYDQVDGPSTFLISLTISLRASLTTL